MLSRSELLSVLYNRRAWLLDGRDFIVSQLILIGLIWGNRDGPKRARDKIGLTKSNIRNRETTLLNRWYLLTASACWKDLPWPAVVKRMKSWRLTVKVAGSNPPPPVKFPNSHPSVDHFPWKMMHIVTSLLKKVKDKNLCLVGLFTALCFRFLLNCQSESNLNSSADMTLDQLRYELQNYCCFRRTW